jgi:hypothetical protein
MMRERLGDAATAGVESWERMRERSGSKDEEPRDPDAERPEAPGPTSNEDAVSLVDEDIGEGKNLASEDLAREPAL